ncbi:DUF6049 family protein [Streptomyces kunmingensis]|uniref:DUF6049 family protein n=1 Tax=Streptomyces kunmingensis TaxID=68225 RepID=A0ABU6CMH3_9ACTN|nr:DUF6049 family protein [Streptomyces kunmingensis]MEB3965935.1 DUF6049 family protein [Streptomyces kunmingensis]
MSPSPARRLLRRTGVLLAAAPLLAALPLLPGAAPASASAATTASADATGTSTVDVAVNQLSPVAPTAQDTLTVRGTITNKGRQAVTDAHVGLRVGASYGGRSAIDDAAKSGTGGSPDGTEVSSKYAGKLAKLAPGATQDFALSVPVKELHLGADGVYQISVALMGQTAAQPYQQTLGIQRTFLPWQPSGAGTRTRTTALWPLISDTHLTAETGTNEQQTPVFNDDSLARQIRPGGRLQQMLALGDDLDVTWVVDPDLLASVDAMTEAYKIKGANGKFTSGKDQAIAKEWLSDLQTAVEGRKVVTLPFADPDLASLAHTGTKVTGSLGRLKDATDAAVYTVDTILHVKADTSYAWPAEGAVDPDIVKVATSTGADKIIARSDTFKETGSLAYTPSAARPIGGGATAVVADARLSTAFRGDMARAENSTLAVQEFLAQSLMLAKQTDKQRSVVVAPQRMPTTSQAHSMAQALHALQDGTWSQPQSLSAATTAKPDPGATTRVPSTRAYPSSLRKQELPNAAFEQIQSTQSDLENFKVVLTDRSRVVTPFGRAMDREMSTSWRSRTGTSESFRDGVSTYLSDITSQVALIEKSGVRLSGRSATIPVSVQNNLWQDVDHLVLRLTSANGTRLKIGDGISEDKAVKIASGHSQSVKFTTTAKATGPITVYAQLFTEDNQPYGEKIAFKVDATEITPTVMLVIGGGVLLLVLAGFRMYTQRKRAAAAQRPEDGPQDEAAAESEPQDPAAPTAPADVPQQPSDPTADTSPESAAPSGTGERVDR